MLQIQGDALAVQLSPAMKSFVYFMMRCLYIHYKILLSIYYHKFKNK